jgi:predicted porin
MAIGSRRALGCAALAALAAATPGPAGAQVTLYGLIDVGVEWSNDDANKVVSFANGTTAAGESTMRLNNGGSRLGLRGVEDLGGGWRAVFAIEHRFSPDTGSTSGGGFNTGNGAFWNAFSWVGLETPYGRITAGRQYNPVFWTFLTMDYTEYGGYNNWAGVSTQANFLSTIGPIRQDNSVMYRSNPIANVTGYLMYGFGEQTTSATRTDMWGAALHWKRGSWERAPGTEWQAGIAYHSFEVTEPKAATSLESVLVAGGSYRNGTFGASLAYSRLELGGGTIGNVMSTLWLNNGLTGVNRYAGWYLNLLYNDVQDFVGVRNGKALQWGLGYIHPLSRKFWIAGFVGANDISPVSPADSAAAAIDPLRASISIRQFF